MEEPEEAEAAAALAVADLEEVEPEVRAAAAVAPVVVDPYQLREVAGVEEQGEVRRRQNLDRIRRRPEDPANVRRTRRPP